jgi:alpha-galactosidase
MHMNWNTIIVLALCAMASSAFALGAKPTPAEIKRAHDWAMARFGDAKQAPTAEFPFSFNYGGKASSAFLKTWQVSRSSRNLKDKGTERTTYYTDPATGLIVTCTAVEYDDFPTVEWTLTFENAGKVDTPILSDIRPLDVKLTCKTGEFQLHWNTADNCSVDSYKPHVDTLGPNAEFKSAARAGLPTTEGYPYWNVAYDDGGCVVVLGWPGQWSAYFQRDAANGLQLKAGQELTNFKLHPDEKVRAPMAVVQFYDGDWIRGQNVWRRWMVAHNVPRPDGKLVPTHYAACFANLQPLAEEECGSILGLKREGIKLDFWILDAGWYEDRGSWPNTGTWEVDKTRFPKGVREVSDTAHSAGMGFVLWFEPQRAAAGSWLTENHPEWVVGGKNGGIVNLGNPDAWKWVLEKIDGLIVSEGVDVYRQDYNIGPLDYWRSLDAEDRQGITEIKDLTGYLAYWDELLRRHPKMWIDSCASGGRRNDLETMRRAVPLLRSDAFIGNITQQCLTYGISMWLPYYGSGTGIEDEYMFRSNIFPASRIGVDARDPKVNYPLVKRMLAEFRRIQPFLLDDYYPLTPYSQEKNVWIAWQFDSPEKGGGYVQVFRREEAPGDSVMLKLRGLDPKATYAVENLGDGTVRKLKGADLLESGLTVKLAKQPESALFLYRKASK